MRIFEHNFVADKAKIRRRAAARQGFLTQYAAKFAEKTCAYAYEDRFLVLFLLKGENTALCEHKEQTYGNKQQKKLNVLGEENSRSRNDSCSQTV